MCVRVCVSVCMCVCVLCRGLRLGLQRVLPDTAVCVLNVRVCVCVRSHSEHTRATECMKKSQCIECMKKGLLFRREMYLSFSGCSTIFMYLPHVCLGQK